MTMLKSEVESYRRFEFKANKGKDHEIYKVDKYLVRG